MLKDKLIFITALLFLSSHADAGWDILKTPHFTCFYPEGYKWEAEQALNSLEHYQQQVVDLTGNRRIGNLPVVIEDPGMLTNGFADPIFKNMHIFTYPSDSLTPLGITENWYRQVGVHEYTHIAQLTRTEGIPLLLTTINGSIYQPNLYSPGWLDEGIAVFAESQISSYEGRLNDGGFDSLIKANVKENKPPSLLKATYSPLEFPAESGVYVYGSEFFKYLGDKYGKEKFAQFFEATSGAGVGYSIWSLMGSCIFPYFGIDRAARKIYGKSFPKLFSEWRDSLNASDWKVDGEQLTEHGWMTYYPILSGNKLYYIRSYPKKTGAMNTFYFNEIVERDPAGEDERVVVSTTSEFVGNIRMVGDSLYYAVAELKKGYNNSSLNGFGVCSILHKRDLSGKDKVLIGDRMRGFDVSPDGRIIYAKDREHAFGSELWTWSAEKGKEKLASFDYLISEILCLEDGKMAVVARKDWENWNVYLLDAAQNEFKPIMPTPFGEFSISHYGKKILFASNYEKAYSIYAYDTENGKTYRLTDTKGFASFPVFDGNSLYFVGLNSAGLDIYKKSPVEFEEITIKDYPGSIPPVFSKLKAKKGTGGDYLKTLLPGVHIPIGLPYPIGAVLIGQDAVGENLYTYGFIENDDGGYDSILFLSTSRFKPSILSLNASRKANDDSMTGLHWDYPLRRRLAEPLSVFVGLGGTVEEKETGDAMGRRTGNKKTGEIDASTQLSLNFPKTKVEMCVGTGYCSQERPSVEKINWQSWQTGMDITQYTNDSQVKLGLYGTYRPDAPEKEELRIRGYGKSVKSNKLAVVSAEYTRPVLSINGGLWNPNIFLYDLCLSVFTEAGFAEGQESQVSGGIELWQEFGGFLGYIKGAMAVIGVVGTKEGKNDLTTYLSIRFPGAEKRHLTDGKIFTGCGGLKNECIRTD